jgi:hypothetical protein
MRFGRLLSLIAVVAPWVAVAPAHADSARTLVATMRAEESTPVPGPAGAKGTAKMVADVDSGKVCYKLSYDGPGTITDAHIHRGEKGVNGPVTITLDAKAECVTPGSAPIKALVDWPDGYYVDVHTALYQAVNGAVRGQVANG